MHSVLGNAAHPERVHVAVCQQIKLPHEACLQKDTPHPEQVQTITVPYFQVCGRASTTTATLAPMASSQGVLLLGSFQNGQLPSLACDAC